MTEPEKFVKCTNCKQDIPESKMFLHEGFCLRNNKLCPKCNKVFLIQEFDEHLKTHNQKPKPPIPQKTTLTNQKKEENPLKITPIKNPSIKENIIKKHPKEPPPKKTPVIISASLGLKQCEYCLSMEENIQSHYLTCKAKKMVEREKAQYYRDLAQRNKIDQDLAKKLAKEKIMDTSKDEQMAKIMQRRMKPVMDTSKDAQMARNMQKKMKPDTSKDEYLARNMQRQMKPDTSKDAQMARNMQKKMMPIVDTSRDEYLAKIMQNKMKPIIDTSKDEMMARNMQKKMKPIIDTSKDEMMARNMQKKFGNFNVDYGKDEELARELEKEERQNQIRNMGNNNFDMGEMDDDLRRAIEESKKDFQ